MSAIEMQAVAKEIDERLTKAGVKYVLVLEKEIPEDNGSVTVNNLVSCSGVLAHHQALGLLRLAEARFEMQQRQMMKRQHRQEQDLRKGEEDDSACEEND